MPTVITVPMLINFPKNSHAYGKLGAYTYSEGKSTYFDFICNLVNFCPINKILFSPESL